MHHLADAPPCTPADSVVTINAPTAYACHEHFRSTVSIENLSCAPMSVTQVAISAMVTSGACGPAGPGMYTPKQADVAPNETAVELELMSGPFCCLAPGCQTPLQCDEAFTFMVTTNAGTFTSTSSAHLSLDGCPEVCP